VLLAVLLALALLAGCARVPVETAAGPTAASADTTTASATAASANDGVTASASPRAPGGAVTGPSAGSTPVAAVTLSDPSSAPPVSSTVEPPVPAFLAGACPDPVVPGLTTGTLPADTRCGTLTVPAVRNGGSGATVTIAAAVRPASAPAPGAVPLVFLAGGPGESAMVYAANRPDAFPTDRDVVFVEQRGALHAEPFLSCPGVEAFTVAAISLASADPTALQQRQAAVQECRAALAATGLDPAAFSTTESALDVRDLRRTLGVAQWDVSGVSYGGSLARAVARVDPEGVRALVLDSPISERPGAMADRDADALAGVQAVAAACAAQDACADAYGDLVAVFTRLVERYSTAPVTLPIQGAPDLPPVVLDGAKVVEMVAAASAVPGSAERLPAVLAVLDSGDLRPAVQALLTTAPPGLLAQGLYFEVGCRQWPALPPALGLAGPHGPVAAAGAAFDAQRAAECTAWGATGAATAVPTAAAVPTLVLSGELDGITPPGSVDPAVDGGTPTTHVVVPGVGHGVLFWTSCGARIVSEFLADPTGRVDTGCADAAPEPKFWIR
jgi:pimeloyl-ACP methyl ester carboxylesterase